MRLISLKQLTRLIPSPRGSGSNPAVAYDLLRLLAYAVVSGIAFSALAIGVVLAVSRNSEATPAEAQWEVRDGLSVLVSDAADAMEDTVGREPYLAAVDSEEQSGDAGSPGNLYLGDGCGSEALVAAEREWYVTIDGEFAVVQVMQTFLMPETEVISHPTGENARGLVGKANPWFGTSLPKGAKFLGLTVDTSRSRLTGRPGAHEALEEVEFEALIAAHRIAQASGHLDLFVGEDSDYPQVSTAEVFDAKAGETIVVTYRYRIRLEKADGLAQLSIALNDTVEEEETGNRSAGAVWIEWPNPRLAPVAIQALPHAAVIERNLTKVTGVSWSTPHITPGEKFQLAWRHQ